MIKKYFGDKARKAKSSERAEAMPAAIITAIVSSLLLLGIASAVSLVVQEKAESESGVALATVASNIDVSLRSDVTSASYISASAKLQQPTTSSLLSPTDIRLNGVNMHIPESSGECKVIRWNINGNTASRDLTIYKSSTNTDSMIKCDTTSLVVAERNKVFADDVKVNAPFEFHNQVGRALAFTLESAALNTVNTELQKQLTAKGVTKLNDADFNELNKLVPVGGFAVGFSDPAACVMNSFNDKNSNGKKDAGEDCLEPESDTVTAAWNSMKIAKVSVAFEMSDNSGETVKRSIEQNSSVPLYSSAAEAEASVANSSADNRPAAPVVSLSTSNVILGTNYNINWTQGEVCPIDMSGVYKLYENGSLIATIAHGATRSFTKNYTNSATQNLSYTVQTECVRGAHVVNSDMSAAATAKVTPAGPTLNITNQPATTNAALNSNLTAAAVCLYGTTPKYKVTQNIASYGTSGSSISLNSVNQAINSGFTVVAGARYQYSVEAWCASAFENSSPATKTTNTFTTAIKAPATPVITAPLANAANVATSATVAWNAVVCEVGSTPRYYGAKNLNGGAAIAHQVIRNWTTDLNLATSNTEGNTVGYAVKALCQGSAVPSVESGEATVRYTTLINTPATPAISAPIDNAVNVPTNAPVTWTAVTCPTGTTTQYYAVKDKNAGASISAQVINNWTTAITFASNNTEGNTVGYSIAARCNGLNVASSASPSDTVTFTTAITAPTGTNFTAPADNATNVATNATVTWSVATCATGTTAQYYATKNMNAGAAITAQVIRNWTTNLNLVSNNTQGNTVGYDVVARCVGPNANSTASAADTLEYTTVINTPAIPAFIAPADNETDVTTNATVSWTAVTCPTATTTQYYAVKDLNAGNAITAQVIRNWTTNLNLVSSNTQGNTVGYSVAARCAGPNASSAPSAADSLSYTTLINAPAAPAFTIPADNATGVATNATVSWAAATCATGTTTQYYATKNLNNGATIIPQVIRNWTTNLNLASSNTQGSTVGYDVKARCVGPNVTSIDSPADALEYTTAISAPAMPVFTTPLKGATDVATNVAVNWSAVTCATGTTVQYYSNKVLNAGATIADVRTYGWGSGLSFVSNNTQGNRVGYEVMARCVGPNATSGNSATDSLTYTTLIMIPATPSFTAPAANATGVATNATVTWSAVTCATGTTVQYYSNKVMNAGATIADVRTYGWGSGLSFVSNNTQGNTVGYDVTARCVGPNATSGSNVPRVLNYTTMIAAPAMPVFTAPSPKGTTDVATNATVTWSAVTCATGTTVQYYSNKVLNAGATIADVRTYGWGSGLSFTSSNTEGNRVGYDVMARCVGPNATSVNSAADLIHYTTLINTPVAPVITAPIEGATGVSLTQTIAWNAVICPTGTTTEYYPYQYIDAYRGLGAQASTWQTARTLATNELQGNRVGFAVRAKCVGPNAESGQSPYDTVTYTTLISNPVMPEFYAPTAATNVPTTSLLAWDSVTCAAGTSAAYYLVKTTEDGVRFAANYVELDWATPNTFRTANPQGSAMGYAVKARCEGKSANSVGTSWAYLYYTTAINAPAMPTFSAPSPKGTTNVATNATVSWNAVTCAAGTTVQYYSNKVLNAGATIADVRTYGWGTARSFVSSNTQGNRVGYEVMARCSGPNADSASSAADLIHYTTLITAPAKPNITVPANDSTGISTGANVWWDAVTCATGTTPEYYAHKTMNAGVMLATPQVQHNWETPRYFATSNTQGNKVGYTVKARCAGPSANSAESGVDPVIYTTAINAPAAPTWSAPAGTWNVPTSQTLSWNAVTCATGTSVTYFMAKSIEKGVNVTNTTHVDWKNIRSFAVTNKQGYTMGYALAARCEGPNADSGRSAWVDKEFTTIVNPPGAVTARDNNWNTVQWSAPSNDCATEATIQYRVNQTKLNNVATDQVTAFTTNLSSGLPTTGRAGHPQWANVEARCAGANANSTVTNGANTTKWVINFGVALSAEMGEWRRLNVSLDCPAYTTVDELQAYVAAEGWGGARHPTQKVQSDEGFWVPAYYAGSGDNSGWMNLRQDVNYKYLDHAAYGYTDSTGNWGTAYDGLGAKRISSREVIATYWNGMGWGNYGYWWYGTCSTPYVEVTGRSFEFSPSSVSSVSGQGNPYTRYNTISPGTKLTTAGADAIK